MSVMEVYYDHENHDHGHDNDSQTFLAVKVHSIHHPGHIGTSFQTIKPTFKVNIGAEF
jgi:hypothetical protein